MKFFLKKYAPIFEYKNNIQIGFPKDQYVEVKFTEDTRQKLEHMLNDGLTEDEIKSEKFYRDLRDKDLLDPEPRLRFSRKELFFDYQGMDYDAINLKQRIFILGAGGAGSTMAYLLAQFGFSNLVLLDFDIIEEADLEKTMVYRRSEMGKKKVEVLRDYLKDNFNVEPEIYDMEIRSEQELIDVVDKVQPELIVKSFDPDMIFRKYLNNICYTRNIPFVYLAYSYVSVRLGPFFVPGVTACDMCLLKYLSDTYNANREDYTLFKRIYKEHSIHPTVSFNINIMANTIFKDIIFFNLGRYDYVTTLGQTMEYIPLTFKGITYKYTQNPECAYCAKVPIGTEN